MKKKQILIATLILVFAITGYFGIKGIKFYNDMKEYKKQVAEISISNVDLTKVADGTYIGNCDTLWVGAEVSVAVKNHKIEDIQLLNHRNGKGKAAEVIPEKVVLSQSLKVDTITGATVSSKVILKAIEVALTSTPK